MTNAPGPPHWTLNSCFGVLHGVWVHLGSFRNCMKLSAKWVELVQLLQKFIPRSHVGIFHNDRNHWTLYQCFGAFRSIWVHLGSLRNCMKLVAKHTELVELIQKFVPRSRIVIFRNQRTPSTQLNPNMMFRCVL